MREQIVFQEWEVRHGRINHRRKGIVAVFCNNYVTTPCMLLLECSSLNFTYAFVNWEHHAIARDGGVKDYVGIREFSVHTIQSLHKLN